MNSLVKVAVAGVLALGAATGASAASLSNPNTGSSDLILIVENSSTKAAYALDTGISLDSILPTGSLVSGASLNTSLPGISQTIAASSALQSFLASNPASGDVWTLTGGQYAGGGDNVATNQNSKAPGAAKAVFASQIGTTSPDSAGLKTLANIVQYENQLVTQVQAGGPLGGLSSATEIVGAGGQDVEQQMDFWSSSDMSALGSSAVQLFGFTGNGVIGKAQSYILGTATLDANGNLTIAANSGGGTTPPPTVPLPAAVWLFGSGLLGFFGVSRRRNVAA